MINVLTLSNKEIMKQFPINTNIMYEPGNNVTEFGTVVGYQYNVLGEMCIVVKWVAEYKYPNAAEGVLNPGNKTFNLTIL